MVRGPESVTGMVQCLTGLSVHGGPPGLAADGIAVVEKAQLVEQRHHPLVGIETQGRKTRPACRSAGRNGR